MLYALVLVDLIGHKLRAREFPLAAIRRRASMAAALVVAALAIFLFQMILQTETIRLSAFYFLAWVFALPACLQALLLWLRRSPERESGATT